MAKEYRPVDREQQFLLPPDMGSWLPADHLAWFVIDAVAAMDTSALHARSRRGGVGRQGFDPDMLLALLIYAYALGERSSRQIERLCGTDVAFRVICAQDVPDHSTLARFRQRHAGAVQDLFTEVLVMCARAGLGRFGRVALDGTKIAANASPGANRGEAALRRLAEEMITEAEQVDAAEDTLFGPDSRGDELPPQLRDRSGRRARIRTALDDLAAERRSREQDKLAPKKARVAKAEANLARQRRRREEQAAERAEREAAAAAAGRGICGMRPIPTDEHIRVREALEQLRKAQESLAKARAAAAQAGERLVRNTTDPDSRLMPTRGGGWLQGYNAQIVASDDHLILATALTQNTADTAEFDPMIRRAGRILRQVRRRTGRRDARIGCVLADAGYLSTPNLTSPGPDRLIAAGSRRNTETDAREQPAQGPPPPDATPLEAMQHRLRTTEGLADYRRRGATVEPRNAALKEHHGLRRFARRGLPAAASELAFTAMVANLLRLHRTGWAPT